MSRRIAVVLLGLVVWRMTPSAQAPKPQQKSGVTLTAPMLKALSARAIGPAVMGGRISDIAFDPENPWTYYVATAHGGLMKTTDNGGTFTALTDKQDFSSTGAVAVAPSDPKVIWLGTGEANDRNSSGWGTGVYRSSDGGSTWT